MDKRAAMARLGLTGTEDVPAITLIYGARLSEAQQALVEAKTDVERRRTQLELAELVEAYQSLTHSADVDSATEMRPAVPAPPAMGPGVVLSDRFVIKTLLGQGGMGNVYAAHDRLKEQDVAIKVLRQDLLASQSARERLLAEAKVSCDLSHPNIVRVYDVGSSDGYYYLSMELLKGCTLRQRMRATTRKLTTDTVTDIATQLFGALRHAHRTIVHRDIKPENIWLTDDGVVKLMDFGIARAYSNSNLTMTGMSLGTAYYMAPEQCVAAKEVDWRADQYSVGIVLYELLTGSVPMGAAKSLGALRPDLPKRYARAVMRAIEPKPQERFESMDDFLLELQAPRPRPVRATVALVAAGAVLAVLAVPAFRWDAPSGALAPAGSPPRPEVRAASPAPPPPVTSPLLAPDAAPVTDVAPSEMMIEAGTMAVKSAPEVISTEAMPASEAGGAPAADPLIAPAPEQAALSAAPPQFDAPPPREEPHDEPPPPREDPLPPPPPRAREGGKWNPPNKCVARCQKVEGDCHHGVVTRRDQCTRISATSRSAECHTEARKGERICIRKGQDCRSSCR
jgi:tRNA A-37 threonylcarbamoyl transferase component Bud32